MNETSTTIDAHPCTGPQAELTVIQSGVIHFSAFADGTVHFTGTLRGTFSSDALPADGIPEATGRYCATLSRKRDPRSAGFEARSSARFTFACKPLCPGSCKPR